MTARKRPSQRRSQRRAARRHLTPGQPALSPGNPPSDRSTRSRWHKRQESPSPSPCLEEEEESIYDWGHERTRRGPLGRLRGGSTQRSATASAKRPWSNLCVRTPTNLLLAAVEARTDYRLGGVSEKVLEWEEEMEIEEPDEGEEEEAC
eukprot:scaffold6861_cov120-Isochrysis_galbana.AAC.6